MHSVDGRQVLKPLWDAGQHDDFQTLRFLLKEYRDIRVYMEDAKLYIASKSINAQAEELVVVPQANDQAPLVVFVFKKVHGGRMYSDPPFFHVANREENSFGYSPLPDWKAFMEEHKVSKAVIAKVENLLLKHPLIKY